MWQKTNDLIFAFGEFIKDARLFFSPIRIVRRILSVSNLRAQFRWFYDHAGRHRTRLPVWRQRFLIDKDFTRSVNYEPHYVYHCSWACRILANTKPSHHIDVGSSMHFVGMASAWVSITHYDYRKPEIALEGLSVGSADLVNLPFPDGTVDSLSCMHVIEHIGLGRYGDAIDSVGDRRAAEELMRVLAPGGQLLLVVPVGRPRINFNAHRVYSYSEVKTMFSSLNLSRFSLLTDDGAPTGLVEDAAPDVVDAQDWGCGCFLFRKVV